MQRPQQIFVPLDIKVRMQPALHQHAGAAEGDGFVDPLLDLFDRMNVGVRLSGPSVKSTEGTDDIADICVIDVAVDDVCDHVGRVLTHPDLVRGQADTDKIVRFQQLGAVVSGQSFARKRPVENRLDRSIHLALF